MAATLLLLLLGSAASAGDQVFDVRGVVAPRVVTRVAGSHLTSLLLAGHRRCARVPVPGGMYGRGVLSAASWCNAVLYAALPQAAVADTGSGEFTSLGRAPTSWTTEQLPNADVLAKLGISLIHIPPFC